MCVDTCIGLNERALELVEDAEVVNPEGGGSYPTIWTGDWPLASYVTEDGTVSVSYTHLTLPTNYSV